MTLPNFAALINLLGFLTGLLLFSILLNLVWRNNRTGSPERLLLVAGLLGIFWNLGALVVYGARDWEVGRTPALFDAAVFTALGFLPAVVVHSALSFEAGLFPRRGVRLMAGIGYGLSGVAGLMHFREAWIGKETPSGPALRTLTMGLAGLTVALVVSARRSSVWKRMLWLVALSVFAVSALHLSRHSPGQDPWFNELIGHHASLPLVLAMLYQDYRFALADLFLKRALASLALLTGVGGLSFLIAGPHIEWRELQSVLPLPAAGALLLIWLAMALAYPRLRKGVEWLVDAVILGREDYRQLKEELAAMAAAGEDIEAILEQACGRLRQAFTAGAVRWELGSGDDPGRGAPPGLIRPQGRITTVMVPTHESPYYRLIIDELSGGRQLLSDDLELLESAALILARRIDAIRVIHERYAGNLREQEMRKLAAEAELRALRAQLNPHFLFNALTTIGYLIQTEPERALETLMRLTGVLRSVLRAPSGEMVTLGEEIDLIESYLAIERARFEERLQVHLDVPDSLRRWRIAPLLLQPLVENAIKHGISPSLRGGDLFISARMEGGGQNGEGSPVRLSLRIRDTGVGVEVADGVPVSGHGGGGVGLANVRRRLSGIYGDSATWKFTSRPGEGASVEMWLPLANEGFKA